MEELVKEVIHEFEEILTPVSYKQGELLHRQHELGKLIYIVKRGVLRSYYYIDGKDITAHFAMDYSIIGPIDSLVKGKRSLYNIEALEPSEVYLLDYSEMEAFLDHNLHLERLARKISQYLYIELVERLEHMTFLSAKERYDRLLHQHPQIIHRVNLGHIASYLGITQETLSRVRSVK